MQYHPEVKKLSEIYVSVFYAGYSPVAPGTVGSICATLALWLLWSNGMLENQWTLPILTVVICILGELAIEELPSKWAHDDQRIVIDEVAGIFISMIFLPISMTTLLSSLVIFRILDIWKPLGIRRMDRLNTSIGVILDDLLAGFYTNIILRSGMLLLPII